MSGKLQRVKSKLLYFMLLLAAGIINAQERKVIDGKVMAGEYAIGDVLVVNISSQREVRTDGQGFFKLAVKEGDSIAVVDHKIISREFVLEAKDLESTPLIIHTEASSYVIEEVVIDAGPKIDAVSLGIIPKDMKMPNRTERREYAANTDAVGSVIKAFSANKKMYDRLLKQAEEDQRSLETLNNLFEDFFYRESLKITDDLIAGFKYYAIGSQKLLGVLHSENKGIIQLALIELAKEYAKLQTDEK